MSAFRLPWRRRSKIPRKTLPNSSDIIRDNDNRCAWDMVDDLNQFFALKAHNTAVQYRRIWHEFCHVLRLNTDDPGLAAHIAQLTHADATRYINHIRTCPAQKGRSALVSDKVSNSTIKHKVVVLCSIWDHLLQLGHISSNPWRKFKADMRRIKGNDRRPHQLIPFEKVREIFTLEFVGAEGARDKALLAALFGGALRINEALCLRLCDVAQRDNIILLTLRNTKRQRAEQQPVGSWAAAHISAYLEIRKREGATDLDPFFTKYRAGRPINELCLDRTIRRNFTSYMRRVGLTQPFSPHCARATAITKLLEDGLAHRDVVKFSRHSSVNMLEHYDKLRRVGGEDVADLLKF